MDFFSIPADKYPLPISEYTIYLHVEGNNDYVLRPGQ